MPTLPHFDLSPWVEFLLMKARIQLGLHPHAMTLVAEMFKRLSKKRQIFIATQSPYLVDCFELENIIIISIINISAIQKSLTM